MLHLDLAEHPGNPAVLYRLGALHHGRGDFSHAECCLNDCLQQLAPSDPHYGATALGLVDCHLRKGDLYRAREVAQYVCGQGPDHVNLLSALSRVVAPDGGQEGIGYRSAVV